MSISKKYRSVGGVAGAFAVGASAVVGCGGGFGAADCQETHTCVVNGGTAPATGEGGRVDSSGESAGTAGETPESEGGAAGVSATEDECQNAPDCSNGLGIALASLY